MTLRDYLAQTQTSVADFAKTISVSATAAHRYMTGTRIPHAKVMHRIVAATNGRVGPADFYAHSGEAA